jgi:ABC-type Fe3+/spermidine/putrescine transport system ATPase subunit
MNEKSLQVVGLEKAMPGFVLRADFTVAPGERVALRGPSGMGKTTLLRLLSGLERADRGLIRLGGRDLTEVSPEQRALGVVFQEAALFSALSAIENVAFGLKVRGMARPEREARALRELERMGLGSRAHQRAAELSGGERQRVAMARAWVWGPEALLLDEPFSALDAALRDQIRRDVLAYHAERPVPLLLVTHDESDIRALATRTLSIVPDPADPRVRIVRSEDS